MLTRQLNGRRHTAAFTLVELLVVVAILLLITVTAIPLLAPSDVQKVRDAASTVNGMINRVKAAAAAHDTRGAGLWLQPLDDSEAPGAVLDMYTSLSLDPYAGDDPETAGVYVYDPAISNAIEDRRPLQFAGDPADGYALVRFEPSGPVSIRILIFPADSCASIWDLCQASSRATIGSGDKCLFKLLPRKISAVHPNHLPQPYRRWDAPCRFEVFNDGGSPFLDGNGNPIGEQVAAPRHPVLSDDYRYNFGWDTGTESWEYPTVPWTDECFIGVLLAAGANVTSASTPYYGYRSLHGTPANSPEKVSFKIDRPNTRAPTPPLTLPAGYAIDITWSGWGNILFRPDFGLNSGTEVVAGFDYLEDMVVGGPVQLMFSKDGIPYEFIYLKNEQIYQGAERVEAYLENLGDVFLLVGRADRCGMAFDPASRINPAVLGANWQYSDSRWIRISRTTGQVTISEPYPNATTLNESLIYAKAGIPAGRG